MHDLSGLAVQLTAAWVLGYLDTCAACLGFVVMPSMVSCDTELGSIRSRVAAIRDQRKQLAAQDASATGAGRVDGYCDPSAAVIEALRHLVTEFESLTREQSDSLNAVRQDRIVADEVSRERAADIARLQADKVAAQGELERAKEDAKAKIARRDAVILAAEQDNEAKKNTILVLERDVEEAREDADNSADVVASLQGVINGMNEEFETCQNEVDQLESLVAHRDRQINKLHQEVRGARAAAERNASLAEAQRQRAEMLEAELQHACEEAVNAEQALASQASRIELLQAELDDAAALRDADCTTIDELTNRIERVESELNDALSSNRLLQDEVGALNDTCSSYQTVIDVASEHLTSASKLRQETSDRQLILSASTTSIGHTMAPRASSFLRSPLEENGSVLRETSIHATHGGSVVHLGADEVPTLSAASADGSVTDSISDDNDMTVIDLSSDAAQTTSCTKLDSDVTSTTSDSPDRRLSKSKAKFNFRVDVPDFIPGSVKSDSVEETAGEKPAVASESSKVPPQGSENCENQDAENVDANVSSSQNKDIASKAVKKTGTLVGPKQKTNGGAIKPNWANIVRGVTSISEYESLYWCPPGTSRRALIGAICGKEITEEFFRRLRLVDIPSESWSTETAVWADVSHTLKSVSSLPSAATSLGPNQMWESLREAFLATSRSLMGVQTPVIFVLRNSGCLTRTPVSHVASLATDSIRKFVKTVAGVSAHAKAHGMEITVVLEGWPAAIPVGDYVADTLNLPRHTRRAGRSKRAATARCRPYQS